MHTQQQATVQPPSPPPSKPESALQSGRSLFVTVGTTLFDPLVQVVSSVQFLQYISTPANGGYTSITVQYGKGEHVPFLDLPASSSQTSTDFPRTHDTPGTKDDGEEDGVISRVVRVSSSEEEGQQQQKQRAISCRAYRFKPTLAAEMSSASLILSHAGAGSIMEGLSLPRTKLAVVINSTLMHNHQWELAGALERRGYLFVVKDPEDLLGEDVLRKIEEFVPKRYPGGDMWHFPKLLDGHMGFADEEGRGVKKSQ